MGRAFTASFEAQISMFPLMVDEDITSLIATQHSQALGWKLSGAGGGGYLTLFSERPIPGALSVKIRRRHSSI